MKFFFFHLMPYRDLPDDFEERYEPGSERVHAEDRARVDAAVREALEGDRARGRILQLMELGQALGAAVQAQPGLAIFRKQDVVSVIPQDIPVHVAVANVVFDQENRFLHYAPFEIA